MVADYDELYCPQCDDEKGEHNEKGCTAVHGGCGPADNTDVYEIDCDCALPFGEREVEPW